MVNLSFCFVLVVGRFWSFVVGRGEFKESVSSWLNCWVISKYRYCLHSGFGHLWDSTRNQHGVGGAWPASFWDGIKRDLAHRVHYTPCLGDSPHSICSSPRDRWINWLINWLIDWLIDWLIHESMLNLRNRKFTQLFIPVPFPFHSRSCFYGDYFQLLNYLILYYYNPYNIYFV